MMLTKDYDNKILYTAILISPIIIYFFYLSSFPMTYDELKRVHGASVDLNWLRQGRWGMYYLNMFYSSNPVFPFFGIYLSSVLSGFFIIKLLLLSNKNTCLEVLIFSLVVFLSYPSTIYFYDFSTISYSLGFIYILSFLSVVCFFKHSIYYNLLSVLLLSTSISIYQSSITLFVVMFIIFIFFSNEFDLKYVIIKFITCIFLSLSVYYFSVKFFIAINNVEMNSYISNFVQCKFDIISLKILIFSIFHHIYEFYIFSSEKFLGNNYFLVTLSFAALVVAFFDPKKIINHHKITIFLMLLIIILCPFALDILSPNDIPTRTLIALPLTLSFLIFILLSTYNSKALMLLICLAVAYNFISINKLSFISKNSWEYDKRIASMMIDRIYYNSDYIGLLSSEEKVPVHLVGFMNRVENQYNRQTENVGKSFFSWGDNELLNIARLFNTLGFNEFQFADPPMLQSHFNQIREMPNWPENGSIRIISGAVVIKVSDYSEAQVKTMCSTFKKNSMPDSCLVTYNPQSIKFSIQTHNKDVKILESHILKDSRLVNAKYSNGVLFPLSSDSQIILPDFNKNSKNSEISLSIKGDYKKDDVIELYFKTSPNEGYSPQRMIRIKVPSSSNIVIRLPSYIFENEMRIDPSIHSDNINNFSLDVNM